MIFNFLLTLGLSCAIGGVLIENSNSSNIVNDNNFHSTINYKIDTSESESSSEISYPIYDDTLKKITLNPTIASTYSLENFYQWISDNLSNSNVEFIYEFVSVGPATFTLSGFSSLPFAYRQSYNGNQFIFLFDNTYNDPHIIDELINYAFYYYEPSIGMLGYGELTNNLTIQIYGDDNYNAVKTAIQADIQANEQSGNMATLQDILSDIVSLLTSGIVGMATGIGSGVNTMITSLVVDNGGMSIFLGVVAIFGGIALAVGITRRIFSWVESLGAKG